MSKPRTGTIYALIDPRDGSTRYIGKTTQDPLERLARHLGAPTNPAMRVWINALGAQGLVPQMHPLKTIPEDKLDAEEKRQIERHAKAGHRLLNAPYYQRNLSDLFMPALHAVALPGQEEESKGIDDFAHAVFGSVAEARAAGRMPRWKAAVHILLRAPVMSVARLMACMAGFRAFGPVLATGLLTFYFWTVGFGRIVKDFVFPYIPIAELARFWDGYLARPMETVGWHFLILMLALGVASYFPVAEAARAARPKSKRRGTAARQPSGVPPQVVADLTRVDVAAAAAAALDSVVLPTQVRRP